MTPLAKLSDRQLDAWLAEHVMGLEVYKGKIPTMCHDGDVDFIDPKHYTTRIEDAWKLLEKILEDCKVIEHIVHTDDRGTLVELYPDMDTLIKASNKSPSRAIAEAIALAFGYEEKE